MKKLLTGLTVPQQYVCVSLEDFRNPLSAYLSVNGEDEVLDVTNSHLFLGYRPLIIAIVYGLEKNLFSSRDLLDLYLTPGVVRRAVEIRQSSLARLRLKVVRQRELQHCRIIYYEGIYGEHRFISLFHQFVNNQRERFRKDSPNNVRLPGNLYDQVRIAYALPRIISLITVSEGNQMNMFPTDLHGYVPDGFYASSLRHGGKANSQVEKQGKLVLSSVRVEDFKAVYALGKNHMQDMRDLKSFSILEERSRILGIPLSSFTLQYRELERIDSFDAGIHRVHFYRVLNTQTIREGYTLAHIHQYYAQSRIDNNMPLNMRLR